MPDFFMQTLRESAVYLVILISLFGIAVGRIPRLRMNRATIAFSGAAFLVALGALTMEEAVAAVDLGTLILILSMMILTANLKLSGFFELAGTRILKAAGTPRRLLALIMAFSAVLSALFLNDTICIMLTPLAAVLCVRAKRNPVPYLIGLALSANIGSAATIIGNPQNMLIGASSGIPFLRFLSRMAVPSILGTAAAYGIVLMSFRGEFSGKEKIAVLPAAAAGTGYSPGMAPSTAKPAVYKPLLYKCLFAMAAMTAAFLLNAPVAAAAMAGAAIVLTTRRIHPEKVFAELDWSVIAFFGGLFIITEGVAHTRVFSSLMAWGLPLIGQNMARFSLFTVVLSNLVSNVPAVMLLKPAVDWFADKEQVWLIMAMASTYAGNLTLLGSVANLIVAEIAKKYGIEIRFRDYLKAGLPVTVITVIMGTLWLVLI
ncbi:anion transporter [Breznakiella homolactica]|uniref:Anion transporter n=1 Tax=Breznakiella homolactica TaxID=2798577 RepID=A0A7T7XL89_9SPIR|nr:anion transporter [Breznakiella homolactica]QQO08272.1 anion transporter [Breznakiella homolactica]